MAVQWVAWVAAAADQADVIRIAEAHRIDLAQLARDPGWGTLEARIQRYHDRQDPAGRHRNARAALRAAIAEALVRVGVWPQSPPDRL